MDLSPSHSPASNLELDTISGVNTGTRRQKPNSPTPSDEGTQRLLAEDKTGQPFRRYIRRGLVGACVPIILTVHYMLTWLFYLRSPESSNGLSFGPSGAQLTFYSWFVLSTIGLDLSEYGLLGAEASMLMSTFWAAPNAWHVMLHGDHSWSGPDGWMEAIKAQFSRDRRTAAPSKLWWTLATPAIVLFIALPLTGLTMEMQDGFRKTNESPNLVGRNYESFNMRSSFAFSDAAHNAWKLALPPRVPGLGVIYTHSNATEEDRLLQGLGSLPNIVPNINGADDLFLAPQTDAPIAGKVWGLIVRYNCTVVDKLQDFEIISRRNGSEILREPSYAGGVIGYDLDDDQIEIRNQTEGYIGGVNYKVVSELGYSRERYGGDFFGSQNSTDCYFNKSEGATSGYPGLEHSSVLELAIWQYATDNQGIIYPPLPPETYDLSLDSKVAGLHGAYNVSRGTNVPSIPMEAIGVQCKSSSAVGTAEVDGVTSTYKYFQKTDTPITLNFFACAPRLARTVPKILFKSLDSELSTTNTWSEPFFTSAEAPPSILTAMSGDNVVYAIVRPTLLQASELRKSMLRAYAAAAVQLMYDGGQGYSLSSSGEGSNFTNHNATSYKPARVLTRGIVPPILPGVLMCLWALMSFTLSVRYAFGRRWAETLDSFSLFQFGGDLSDKVNEMPAHSVKDLTDHEQLTRLPGLIGDSRPGFTPGHVSLVEEGEARKTKKFV